MKIESSIKRAEKMIDKARSELFEASKILQNPPEVQDHEFKFKIKQIVQDVQISLNISIENLFA